ncbi:nucleotidyltransferase domain-containing protein [Spirosoma sp.]|uniref:nucleotidyltransferase domain-containing protein n=1 Tax=Spirosoma sp. TaxID=1899569 RepID=UPI002613E90C|nr:nucleotidyltransferase domain-containing protein [Spirosoma sp.]MCX6216844.1 nucleotidyltransferase domain-containing protein [Spirosoma sp.]
MTIQDLRDNQLILFECISGSRAYGTDLPSSDTDIRGVFILPQADLYGLRYVEQVNDAKNDVIFYELRRFVELLAKNNPNILELLCAPADCVLQKNPLFDRLQVSDFLSKRCRDTFAGYAASQIKKARGLNKKIVNPLPKERKSLLHFCYVVVGQKSIPVPDWLSAHNRRAEQCGLVSVPHARDMYALYYDETASLGFQGLISHEDATAVSLSSVPVDQESIALLYVNHDGYSSYCKDYREYWDWVDKRNTARYENTVEHGKNYDTKNMMHTFRLLDMALEILQTGQVIVRRPNREELLSIRSGTFDYDELLAQAEEKLHQIDVAAQASLLPEHPDLSAIEHILVGLRMELYAKRAY